MMQSPFFTIVTATYNDAWNLSKTMQSISSQDQDLFEYIVIDGNSNDETDSLINFWVSNGLHIKYIKENDAGVYDAMNKGIKISSGKYICFMNSGDKFKSNNILREVYDFLTKNPTCDALLGAGVLGNDLYLPWLNVINAFNMTSLGYCHQSAFIKKEVITQFEFKVEKGKTDSDSDQIARIFDAGKNIITWSKILSVRCDDIGISSDVSKVMNSNIQSIAHFYDLSFEDANILVNFKRTPTLQYANQVEKFFDNHRLDIKMAVAILILDNFIMRSKKTDLSIENSWKLLERAWNTLKTHPKFDLIKFLFNRGCYDVSRFYDELCLQKILKESRLLELENRESSRIRSVNTKSNTDVVVSLTSFPARFPSLHLVIESLFAQTIRPRKVILYLALSEIKNPKWLPKNILKLQKEGLQIICVDNNYFQYNKFYFNQEINKSVPVITVDDDVIYPHKMVEKLLEYHKLYPSCVVANRCHEITYDDSPERKIKPYAHWVKEKVNTQPSHNNFATGVGGVLYPQSFFNKYSLDLSRIMATAPYADDVWLKLVALKNNVKVVSTDLENTMRWYCGYTPETLDNALQHINVTSGLNDSQFLMGLSSLGFSKGNLDEFFGGIE